MKRVGKELMLRLLFEILKFFSTSKLGRKREREGRKKERRRRKIMRERGWERNWNGFEF